MPPMIGMLRDFSRLPLEDLPEYEDRGPVSGVEDVELEYVLLLELGFFFLPIDLDRDLDFLVD